MCLNSSGNHTQIEIQAGTVDKKSKFIKYSSSTVFHNFLLTMLRCLEGKETWIFDCRPLNFDR